MPSPDPEDHVPLEFLINEDALRAKYQQALDSGQSQDVARAFVEEVAQAMMVNEAAQLSFRPEAVRNALKGTVFTDP